MTEPTPGELDVAVEATDFKCDTLAGLDEAKCTLIDALDKLGIVRLDAEVTLEGQTATLGSITASDGDDVRDLAETAPIDFRWGENHRSYDNLLGLARDYLSAVLTHQRHEHLAAGTLYLWVGSQHVIQPVHHDANDTEPDAAEPEWLRNPKAQILAALNGLGVAFVNAKYDGEGDEGQIDGIKAYTADNTTVSLAAVAPFTLTNPSDDSESRSFATLHDCIEEFAWDVLSHYHDGFENNDGGFGKVVIDVAAEKVRLEHTWRITSYECTEAEF